MDFQDIEVLGISLFWLSKKIYFEEIKKLTNFVRKMSEHADSRLGVWSYEQVISV